MKSPQTTGIEGGVLRFNGGMNQAMASTRDLIDFPVADCWRLHYSQEGMTYPPAREQPGTFDMSRLLHALARLSGQGEVTHG